jgi:hypothetical protein
LLYFGREPLSLARKGSLQPKRITLLWMGRILGILPFQGLVYSSVMEKWLVREVVDADCIAYVLLDATESYSLTLVAAKHQM